MLAIAIALLVEVGAAGASELPSAEGYQAASPLTSLPAALRGREDEFLGSWDRARKRLEDFAREHGLDPPDLDDVRFTVVATQKRLPGGPSRVRRSAVAAAGWKSVHVVSPEVFAEVLPEYARAREDAWSRLLAHELSHIWIRVGPRWFREGLAIIAADQGIGDDIRLTSPDPTLTSIDWASDQGAYPRAAAQVRFYLEHIPLRELLEKASSPEFEAWLRNRWQRAPDGRAETAPLRTGPALSQEISAGIRRALLLHTHTGSVC